MKKIDEKQLEEFLRESNNIEREYSEEAFKDAYRAWKFLIFFDELSLSRILECHRVLLKNIKKRIAGKIRKVNVRVGFSIKIDYQNIEERLKLLIEWIPKTKEDIKKWHIEFENIHPFEDGNGRTGRIILNWQLLKNDHEPLIIHEGDEQQQYYQWFSTEK